VNAVEGPDRHMPWARLGIGQLVTVMLMRETTFWLQNVLLETEPRRAVRRRR